MKHENGKYIIVDVQPLYPHNDDWYHWNVTYGNQQVGLGISATGHGAVEAAYYALSQWAREMARGLNEGKRT